MRTRLLLALGALLILIGIYVAIRPLFGSGPVTGSRPLDAGFAVFFLLRGVMNLRAARRQSRAAGPDVPRSPSPN